MEGNKYRLVRFLALPASRNGEGELLR